MKQYGAEFLGTFWLVMGAATAQCLPPSFRKWAPAFVASLALSDRPCSRLRTPSCLSPTAI